MFELTALELAVVISCALLIGISKTALPSLVILTVAVMAQVFPARESIGLLLPMLLAGDLIAVTYYRRSVNWKTLITLLPWVSGGIALGFVLLFVMTASRPVEIIIGLIVICMILLQFLKEKWGARWLDAIPKAKWFAAVMGTLAGFTTMVGNAAGPIMAVFLLIIALPKNQFIGTGAWFFLTVNLIKVPLYVTLGLISAESLTFNVTLIPAIAAGAFAGIKILPYIPQTVFNRVILLLSLAGGLKLLIG